MVKMAFLGNFVGTGRVTAGNKSFEHVPYCLSISQAQNRKEGVGRIEVRLMQDAIDLFQTGEFTLELQTGDKVELIGSRTIEPSSVIEVHTVGPVPTPKEDVPTP
jgi:hypothetical protein